MRALFEREINDRLLKADDADTIIMLTKQAICNEDDHHVFEDAGGGSILGDRFVERCKNCGFENHV